MSKVLIYNTSIPQENISPNYRSESMSAKGVYVNAHFIFYSTRIVDTEKKNSF